MVVFLFGRKCVPVESFKSFMPKTCFGQGKPELGPAVNFSGAGLGGSVVARHA